MAMRDDCRVAELLAALLRLELPSSRWRKPLPFEQLGSDDLAAATKTLRGVLRPYGLGLSGSYRGSGYSFISKVTERFLAKRGLKATLDVTTIRAVRFEARETELDRIYPIAAAIHRLAPVFKVAARFTVQRTATHPIRVELQQDELLEDQMPRLRAAVADHARIYGGVAVSFTIENPFIGPPSPPEPRQKTRAWKRSDDRRVAALVLALCNLRLPCRKRPTDTPAFSLFRSGDLAPFFSLRSEDLTTATETLCATLQRFGLTLDGPWENSPRHLVTAATDKYFESRGRNAYVSVDWFHNHCELIAKHANLGHMLALAQAFHATHAWREVRASFTTRPKEGITVYLNIADLRPEHVEPLRAAIAREASRYGTIHVSFGLTRPWGT